MIFNSKIKVQNLKQKNGFTLIELLVVIAIIGVLAGILFANFVGVRQRARDSQRKSDLRQIQSALELYRSDNGNYPSYIYLNAVSYPCPTLMPFPTGSNSAPNTYYMQKVPCDPNAPTSGGFGTNKADYSYTSAGTTYSLKACIENLNDNDPNVSSSTNYCNAGGTRKDYILTNP